MTPPRVSFHTKGERLPHGESYIIRDQVYVQYLPPTASPVARAAPIVFIHGGGLTGYMWESTPDRRPGWARLAASAGYHVYIPDCIDSGRSQRAPDAIRSAPIEYRNASEMVALFRFGPSPEESYDDCRFSLDHLDRLVGSGAARRQGQEQYDLEMQGMIDVLNEVGPCIVIAHSKAGALSLTVAARVPHLCKRLVIVEPGPHLGQQTVNDSVKKLLIWADYRELSKHALATVQLYTKLVNTTTWHLPSQGIRGNTHMLMHVNNSDEIMQKILDWLET